MFSTIREDIRSILDRDPAAGSWLMVVLCYPGLHAVWIIESRRASGEPNSASSRAFSPNARASSPGSKSTPAPSSAAVSSSTTAQAW